LTQNAPSTGPKSEPAFRSAAAVALFVVLTVSGLAADLASKHAVFESLLNDPELTARAEGVRPAAEARHPDKATKIVLHEFRRPLCCGIQLTLSTNPGVVFGWSMPPWAVIASTVLTVGLVGWFFASSDRRARSMHLAMAFILAGALGNLYDRLYSHVAPLGMEAIQRNVRDFIDCSAWGYPWVFNIADVLLVVGVGVIALNWVLAAVRERKARKIST